MLIGYRSHWLFFLSSVFQLDSTVVMIIFVSFQSSRKHAQQKDADGQVAGVNKSDFKIQGKGQAPKQCLSV